MSRLLPGTPPHMRAQPCADLTPAIAWIEAHYDAFRGQWVAVRLEDLALVASAPTLSQLWQVASPARLQDCLLHYVYTVEEEHEVQFKAIQIDRWSPSRRCLPGLW